MTFQRSMRLDSPLRWLALSFMLLIGLVSSGGANAQSAFTLSVTNEPVVAGQTIQLKVVSTSGDGFGGYIYVDGVAQGSSFTVPANGQVTPSLGGRVKGVYAIQLGLTGFPANYQSNVVTLTVLGAQTISVQASASQSLVNQAVTLSASGQSGTGAVTYEVTSGTCTLSGAQLNASTPQTCQVVAKIAADTEYGAATSSSISVRFGKSDQTVSYTGATSGQVGGTANLTATSTSGLTAFTYASKTASICTVSGSEVSYIAQGTCTISVSQAGDANWNSASIDQNIAVSRGAQTITFSSKPPIGAVVNGTYTPVATATSGLSVVFTIDATSSAVCSVYAGVITFNATGTCKINADQAGNGNWAAASRVSQTVAVGKSASSVVLSVSNAAPVHGASVTLTATVTPTAATGTVQFRDGATVLGTVTLSGGVATLTTSSLAVGPHTLTAVYSGDVSYTGSTSAVQSVTPGRVNPAADSKVRSILTNQITTVQRVISIQTNAIQRRLEVLHDAVPAFSNGISIVAPGGLPAQPYASVDDMGKGRFEKFAGMSALDRQSQPANRTSGPAPSVLSPEYGVWTAGQITLGETKVDGVPEKMKTTAHSIAIGVDRQFREDWKAGVSVGVFSSRSKLDALGTSDRAMAWTGSLYQSWNVTGRFFLDGMIGFGDASFKSSRFDSSAGSSLDGERSGKMLSGSITAVWDEKFGPWRIAPYASYDWSRTWLDAYTETGAAAFALSFEQASLSSHSVILGLRGQYDIPIQHGIISPTLRIEMRHALDGTSNQTIAYTSDPLTTYVLTTSPKTRQSYTGGLGLKATGGGNVTGQIEYLTTISSGASYFAQGMRGTIRVGF